jgi:hypothetical protein
MPDDTAPGIDHIHISEGSAEYFFQQYLSSPCVHTIVEIEYATAVAFSEYAEIVYRLIVGL